MARYNLDNENPVQRFVADWGPSALLLDAKPVRALAERWHVRAARDIAQSAVNAVIGDYLAHRGNPLAIELQFRHCGRDLALTREALAAAYPDATGKLVIFVHGLGCTDESWNLFSRRHWRGERRPQTYGARLQARHGHTPLFVRYNTGLHVSENGRELTARIEKLVAAWPVPVRRIELIGHSMGGLVVRSAAHYGHKGGDRWTGKVRNVVCLGAPHLGAPLEKLTHLTAAIFGAFKATEPVARVFNSRSAGIKDLRWGYVLDEEWKQRDPDALLKNHRRPIPRLPGARYHFIGSAVTRNPDHVVGLALGDGLVRLPSAVARELADADTAVLSPLNHFHLLNHPRAYGVLEERLTTRNSRHAATEIAS